jgi:hypothetical protein
LQRLYVVCNILSVYDVNTLRDSNTEANKLIDIQAVEMSTLRYRLEDQTNRNCRRTLIVKGLPEDGKEKTWKETKNKVVEVLSDVCRVENKQQFYKCVERVHRGKPLDPDSKKTHRDIHMLFFDWNDSQMILKNFLKYGRGKGIFVEQRYGPDTTARRNLAMIERRTLLDSETIAQGFVQYPAQLMVKYDKEDKDFVKKEDYSHVDIKLTRKEGRNVR